MLILLLMDLRLGVSRRIAQGCHNLRWCMFGDGRLDEEGREVVPVRGLPEGAKLSYPYLRSDGNTLHFAVEQEGVTPANTLGGRDIYEPI